MWDILERINSKDLLFLIQCWSDEYYALIKDVGLNRKYIIQFLIDNLNELIQDDYKLIFILDYMSDDELKEYFFDIQLEDHLALKLYIKNEKNLDFIRKRLISEYAVQNKKTRVVKESTLTISGGKFYELLDYQLYIKEQVSNLIDANLCLPRCIVHMPTGTGKTKTMMHVLINYLQNKSNHETMIVWVAHTNTLLQQAESTLINCWKHLGNSNLNIYRSYGEFQGPRVTTCGVLFISIQSLLGHAKKNTNLYKTIEKRLEIMCFDEAHKCLARQTKKIIEKLMFLPDKLNNRILIGLTATPGRALIGEDENYSLAAMFENRIIGIDRKIIESFRRTNFQMRYISNQNDNIISYFQERGILSKLTREELNVPISKNSELEKMFMTSKEDYSKKLLYIISRNVDRNKKVLTRLYKLVEDNIPTIFFAASVQQGKLIGLLLLLKGINVSQVYGDMNETQKSSEIKKFRTGESIILINFNVLTTGFDSTNIKCVFIARPTKSIVVYSQMIGRGLRGPKMGGNEECLLIDVKDNLEEYKDENKAYHYFDEYWR